MKVVPPPDAPPRAPEPPSPPLAAAQKQLLRALQLLAPAGADPANAALAQAITNAGRLADTSPPGRAYELELRGLGSRAIGLVAGRRAPLDVALALGRALDAALAARGPQLLGRGLAPPVEARLIAAHDQPRPRAIERDRFQAESALLADETVDAAEAEMEAEPTATQRVTAELDALGPPPDVEVLPAERGTSAALARSAGATAAEEEEGPVVSLDPEGGVPMPIGKWRAEIVEGCCDTIAMLARHRSERRADERADEETRLLELLDAVAATGKEVVSHVLAWWEGALDSPDPWKVWAPAFVFGCLPGSDALDAIACVLRSLPPEASACAKLAAEALVIAASPERAALAEGLCLSPHPICRAAGVDLAGRLGLLNDAVIAEHLCDPSPPVLAAAARAAARLDPWEPRLAAYLHAAMHLPDPEVAWEASRALALGGSSDPYHHLSSRPALFETLGARALDLLVWFGDAKDVRWFEAARRGPVTGAHLRALGRFGHPRVWSFLAHFLGDEELAPDAALALEVLFGERVPRRDRLKQAAWRSAIAAGEFSPDVRYRRGAPWTLSPVMAEIDRGTLGRADLEDMLEEAAVRGALRLRVDMALWLPDVTAALAAVRPALERADRTYRAGSFECRTRSHEGGAPGAAAARRDG